jgi:hypothetical protein
VFAAPCCARCDSSLYRIFRDFFAALASLLSSFTAACVHKHPFVRNFVRFPVHSFHLSYFQVTILQIHKPKKLRTSQDSRTLKTLRRKPHRRTPDILFEPSARLGFPQHGTQALPWSQTPFPAIPIAALVFTVHFYYYNQLLIP